MRKWFKIGRKHVRHPVKQRYFGIKDLSFHGGVFAADAPDLRFTVSLIDSTGEAVLSTRADRASLKQAIPDGYGFVLPVPYEWLSPPEAENEFQFRIIETGEVFPKVPRTLSAEQMLRKLDRLTTSKYALERNIGQAVSQLASLAAENVVVVGVHEMSRSGAPLIALEIVRQLVRERGYGVILLCDGERGVLGEAFEEICKLVVTDLQSAAKVAEPMLRSFFEHLANIVGDRPALINSICSTRLVEACAGAGIRVVSLVHEYPDAFDSDWMRRHLNLAERIVFPCHDVQQSFAAEGLLPMPAPGGGSGISIIPQGCYLLEMNPLDEAAREACAAKITRENHLRPEDRLVVSCGTIDVRKGFDWFAALIREYSLCSPNAATTHFLWIGRVGDASLFQHLLHDLRQHGVIGHFHHLDEVEDVRPAMGLADVFLLCSRIDPFPSVVLEAIAMGVPVVGFNKGQGCRDTIAESGFGSVVPYQDHGATIRAIDELLSPETDTPSQVQAMGRAFVEERFLYRDYVKKLCEFL